MHLRGGTATILSIITVIFSMLIICYENLGNLNNINVGISFLIGICISIWGGIFGAAIGTYSEKLYLNKFVVNEILAIRFYFLIISGVLIAILGHDFEINIQTIKLFSFSAVFIVILPLVIYQKAIQHLGSLTVSMLIPFTPILAYFMQLGLHKYRFNGAIFIAILFCCLTIGLLNFIRYKQTKKVKFNEQNPEAEFTA